MMQKVIRNSLFVGLTCTISAVSPNKSGATLDNTTKEKLKIEYKQCVKQLDSGRYHSKSCINFRNGIWYVREIEIPATNKWPTPQVYYNHPNLSPDQVFSRKPGQTQYYDLLEKYLGSIPNAVEKRQALKEWGHVPGYNPKLDLDIDKILRGRSSASDKLKAIEGLVDQTPPYVVSPNMEKRNVIGPRPFLEQPVQ